MFDLIDWTAHSNALKRHTKHHSTPVKFFHQLLPLGKQVHRYDPKYPSTCPSCHTNLEDMAHFWKCQAATRLKWQPQFLKDLKLKLFELGTGPQVRQLLLSTLRAVLDREDPERIAEDPSVANICESQRQIRWDQLLKGRFAHEWGTHHRTQQGTKTKGHTLEHQSDYLYF